MCHWGVLQGERIPTGFSFVFDNLAVNSSLSVSLSFHKLQFFVFFKTSPKDMSIDSKETLNYISF